MAARSTRPKRGRKALFVDLDGTVRDTKTGRVHPVKAWDQVIRPRVIEVLRAYKEAGYAIVAVTNQGGVAFGFLTEDDVRSIHDHLIEVLAPGLFDIVLYCPYHPKGKVPAYKRESEDRKPSPGMAWKARDALGLNLARSIMVGDLDTDEAFARNAGIRTYFHESVFFAQNGPRPKKRVARARPAARRAKPAAPKRGTAAKARRR